MNSEMPNLHALRKTRARTTISQVVAAWAIIRSNLAASKKLREVYEAAVRDGLELPYDQFRVYIHRLRKRDLRRGWFPGANQGPQLRQTVGVPQQGRPAPADPLRNLREQRAKKRGFEYDPLPREGLTK
jgi:hypothetical protein